MPYTDIYRPGDMMGDYGGSPEPTNAFVRQPATDFNPSRDIDPMAGRFFGELSSARGISGRDRMRLQGQMLQGITDIETQRLKLDQERQRSIINDIRIKESQYLLEETRRKHIAAREAAQRRDGVVSGVKDIMTADLTPGERHAALNTYELDHLGELTTDPELRRAFDISRSHIPEPRESQFSATQRMEMARSGIPPEVIDSDDPFLIGQTQGIIDAIDEMKSTDEKTRRAGSKHYVESIEKLASRVPEFMDKDERGARGVADGDLTPYLRPQDHQTGLFLVHLVHGPEKVEEMRSPDMTDEERRKIIMDTQRVAMRTANMLAMATPDPEDVEADALVPLP